ncbi:hypothetical protein CMUS01_06512 [Colletotrichum musicola]|uniref:Uncharacterized protein n=1 Tax=Colletotrichum musicola TaxID=2175873 RepID=A0A8H6KLH0_9PEZI|nr:hypothetical protein CMUS01_06512 [Colletotrichum musicola]
MPSQQAPVVHRSSILFLPTPRGTRTAHRHNALLLLQVCLALRQNHQPDLGICRSIAQISFAWAKLGKTGQAGQAGQAGRSWLQIPSTFSLLNYPSTTIPLVAAAESPCD